jgi:hypothetical protein
MARVASCPQCEHDLLVPDDAEPSALVKCPQCRAFFELQHAESRELPAALVVESRSEPEAANTESSKSPTGDGTSSLATSNVELKPMSKENLEGDIEELDFADEEPAAETLQLPQQNQPPGPVQGESPEAAAQRIDAWFRSAKTLSDVPPLESAAAEHDQNAESPEMIASSQTIDISANDPRLTDLSSDFELESTSDSPHDAAPWDDSQHMDRLLADLEGQPVDTLEPASHDAVSAAHDEHEHFQPAGDWTPDESLSIPSKPGKPERKRSSVRTLVVSLFGGIIGLGLGYYALLWLGPVLHRDKEIDFLELAKYLPKSVLPPAFRTDVKQPAIQQSKMVADLAASEKVVKPEPTPPATPAVPPDATAQTPVAPAEKQATYTAPPEPAKRSADKDDRYATPTAKSEPPVHEPAPLEAPPAKAITESTPKAQTVHTANGPSFSAADVTAALAAADAAQAGLVTGNLQDGKEVAHTKGVSYMAIADLAQKATFADSADASKSQQQVDEFFRKLLSNAHTRDEVAQIVPRWLSHPKRPQNGVFLAGSIKHSENKGTVVEYEVELSGGPSVVVVVPTAAGQPTESSTKPIAIVGSIVDKPADDIAGYTGKATQVVFAKKLLPLE